MKLFCRSLAVLTVCLPAASVPAAEEFSVSDVLSRRLIDSERPQQEAAGFIRSRLVPMPAVRSAAEWQAYASALRERLLSEVVFRGSQAAGWSDASARVEWADTIPGGPGYHIRKLRYEVLPGMWVPALLYEPNDLSGRVPVILNVNGHDRAGGKAADYKQIRCINQAKRGMIALNVEWLGMGQLQAPGFDHYRMNQIDLCGESGLAPFYLAMSRGLDLLLNHPHADPERVAVTGLSGGGWQTIVISALDERVRFCNPVAGYSDFATRTQFPSDLGDSEQTPCDFAAIADYSHLTAMMAPRPILLTMNAEDGCCFRAEHALPPLLEAAMPVYRLYGQTDRLRSHVNLQPGDHNFEKDNRQALYRALHDFFFPKDPAFPRTEIACRSELKTPDELHVPLPEDNLDFHRLALRLSEQIRRPLPSADGLTVWQTQRRSALRKVVRLPRDETLAVTHSSLTTSIATIRWQWMRIEGSWTVPAVEITTPQSDPRRLAIVFSDQGRAACVFDTTILLSAGYRVLAVDPFGLGESKIGDRDFLWALLVSSVGERPLGIQAGQILSLARRAREEQGAAEISLIADGPRSSLIALIAGAAAPETIDRVEVRGSWGSLKELIEENRGASEFPEAFCFGLLATADIVDLAAMILPRPVIFHEPSPRVRQDVFPVLRTLRQKR